MKGLNQKWLLPHICEVVYTKHHVNKQGALVHGNGRLGVCFTMGAHLPKDTIHMIDKNIHKDLLVTQVMKKHKERVLAIIHKGGTST